MKRSLFLLSLMCCYVGIATAQDVHLSQYWESSVLRNPGLTGVFTEDYKAGVVYRSQWNSLGNPFVTMVATGEGRFSVNREVDDYITVSLLFYSDKAGRVALKSTGIYPCINYNKSLADPHNSYLSVGFTGGYVQRSFDPNKMTMDEQYQAGVFDPNAGISEELPNAKVNYWDLGAGVSFNSGLGEDNNILYYIGLSGYHFTQPRATFSQQGETVNLAGRWNGSFGLNFNLDEVWAVMLQGNLGFQGTYREYMVGGMVRWARMNESGRRDFGVSAGAQLRFGDAIVPVLKLEYKGQAIGFSYDINNSSLRAATNMRGGLEVTAFFTGLRGGYGEGSRSSPLF
jgi:type IX secretion system PorP/SprF family membrane protein